MLSMVLSPGIGTRPDLIINEWQVVSVVRQLLAGRGYWPKAATIVPLQNFTSMAENGRKRTPGYEQTPVQQLPDRGNKMLLAVVYC